jgi:hypothetical protein
MVMGRKRILCSILVLVFPSLLLAQSETSSVPVSIYEIAFDSALSKLSPSLAVYTGREYYPYFVKKSGMYAATALTTAQTRPGEHPFFLTDEFRPETIVFEGVVYPSINLSFDICRSEVVVLTPQRKAIVLPEGKVQKFNYAGHKFRALTGVDGIKNDFYEILYWSDSTVLCAKRRKNQTELWHMITDYYVILNSQAYPVSSVSTKSVGVKASLLRIFSDREEQMRSFIRQNRLKFSKAKKEQSLIKVIEYYASLKTQ